MSGGWDVVLAIVELLGVVGLVVFLSNRVFRRRRRPLTEEEEPSFRPRSRGGAFRSIGPGAVGSVYDLLNEDRRRAMAIIVEGRAEATAPETRDGNLPELAPGSKPPPRE